MRVFRLPSSPRSRVAAVLVGALLLAPTVPASASPADDPAPVAASSMAEVSLAAPVIVGELAVGRTVTAQPDLTLPGDLTYQWSVGGAPLEGANGPQLILTPAMADQVVQVTVTVTTPDGEQVVTTSENTLGVTTTGQPTVAGTTRTNATLTAGTGTWGAGTTYTYQWLTGSQPIPGATGSKLVLTSAQSGQRIRVMVTGTRPGYQTLSRVSGYAANRVMHWSTPTISGTPAVASTLTAKPGAWTADTTFTYVWYADGAVITGATAPTLKLGTAQKDKAISVKVTGRKTSHTTTTAASKVTARVMTAPTPVVTGSAVVGSTLTVTPGTWTTGATRTIQWYADGVAITGATASTFRLTSAQKDKVITARVTGTKSGWATVAKTSKATLRVQLAPTPTVSGTPKVTYTLTASPGTWSSGTTRTYQWYANGVALTGKTSSTLKLGTGHVGRTITVKVTGKKTGYPTVTRTSRATAAVTYPLVTQPIDTWTCPSWAPIKGNASSMIYHVPSGAYYSRTNPEECFRTEAAAVAAGYRKSKL